MTKKKYISPAVRITTVQTVGFICQSGVGSMYHDIPYAGVDENGTLTPSGRRHEDLWEDTEEEEDY